MIATFRQSAELQGRRWRAVRLGLRLTNGFLGFGAMALLYVLWLVLGLILALAFLVLGKINAFANALNLFALYGFLLPMALIAAIIWAVKLFSRALWCRIPGPLVARYLAVASVAGRLAVPLAVVDVWLSDAAFGKRLFLPTTLACSGIAWLGLLAEWGFIRVLRRELIPADDLISAPDYSGNVVENASEAGSMPEQPKKSILTHDVGEWFKARFPKGYKLTCWIVLPVAYVTASSLADNGDLHGVPDVILRLVVMAPVFLQVFWIPSDIDRLIDGVSEKTMQENLTVA